MSSTLSATSWIESLSPWPEEFGLELMSDIPFHTVNIHSTINAPDGRRMSKSLGTGIDPLDTVN